VSLERKGMKVWKKVRNKWNKYRTLGGKWEFIFLQNIKHCPFDGTK